LPHVGHVVRETKDKIVVFGEGDDRYDIPKSAIRFAAGNVLIDLPFHGIVRKYKVSRKESLPTDEMHVHVADILEPVDLATYEGQYAIVREYETPTGRVKEVGPLVYGYSVTVGPDGKPKVREFGNIKTLGTMTPPALTAEREPLADVMATDKDVKVTVEMPGIY
jgi:hypothetical protein